MRIDRAVHGDRDHPGVGATLHALGELSQETGELEKAKQYLEESLRIKRALYGDRDHPGVGATLHALGELSQETGELEKGKAVLGRIFENPPCTVWRQRSSSCWCHVACFGPAQCVKQES